MAVPPLLMFIPLICRSGSLGGSPTLPPPHVHTSAAQGLIPWWQPFLSRLQGGTALVGTTISCAGGGSPGSPDAYGGGIPHVQSHAMAMTQVSV